MKAQMALLFARAVRREAGVCMRMRGNCDTTIICLVRNGHGLHQTNSFQPVLTRYVWSSLMTAEVLAKAPVLRFMPMASSSGTAVLNVLILLPLLWMKQL